MKFHLPQNADPILHSDHQVHPHIICNHLVWFLHITIRRTPERITERNLSTLQDIDCSRVLKSSGKITADPSHPGHLLFFKHFHMAENTGQSKHTQPNTQKLTAFLQSWSTSQPGNSIGSTLVNSACAFWSVKNAACHCTVLHLMHIIKISKQRTGFMELN